MASEPLLRSTVAVALLALFSPAVLPGQGTESLDDPSWGAEGPEMISRPRHPALEVGARGPVYAQLRRLMSGKQKARNRSVKALAKMEPAVLIPLVDAYFFMAREARPDAHRLFGELSGEQPGSRYQEWFNYVGSRTDLEPPQDYTGWKGELFSRIDPTFRSILNSDATVKLPVREILWGGVKFDGIPAIDDPATVGVDVARFMNDTDTVFGVSLGGEHRAYPVKVLSWHELLNDTVGGQPITLSFCTLCGSGILYSAVDENGDRLVFGTSGLLYRSNKLMFDRATNSLWSNLTGEAVIGTRAADGASLTMLPMTLTRWDAWRQRHPDTTVMNADPAVAQRTGYRYVEGAAEQAREGVEFPVWRQSDILERNARVYALRINGEAKAYPLEKLQSRRLVHDTVGGLDIVLVLDRESGAVRAFERRGLTFGLPVTGSVSRLHGVDGTAWTMTEEGLVPEAEGEMLPRVPGHVAFWFGWYAFYPETGVY